MRQLKRLRKSRKRQSKLLHPGVLVGRWTLLEDTLYEWLCRCDCGTVRYVNKCNLYHKTSVSCGCYKEEVREKRCTTHGDARKGYVASEYRIWQGMLRRCYNLRDDAYRYYGGRGIGVSDEWFDYVVFLADMGRRPSDNYSIDRIDNNKGYSKENCKWSTRDEQSSNMRSNHNITYRDRTQTLSEWARELDMAVPTLWYRIVSGWSLDHAFDTHRHKYYRRKVAHGKE